MSKTATEPMAAELEALKEESGANRRGRPPKAVEAKTPEPVAEAETVTLDKDSVIKDLLARVNLLTQQLANQQPGKKPEEDLGPPPPPRSARPHIMVFATPDNCLRIEVPEEYIAQKLPGWDGTPVKGYINHEGSLRAR